MTTTKEDLDALVSCMLEAIQSLTTSTAMPVMVALDGRSGVGKSTLAAATAERLDSCTVIDGDGFYAGGPESWWDSCTAAEKVAQVIDWRRQRPVLSDLRKRTDAEWFMFDWAAFDGRLDPNPQRSEAADVVILDGAYSARPELADLLDLRVLLALDREVRRARLLAREGDAYRAEWEGRWSDAEDHYFASVMPPDAFDLIL